MSTVCIQGLAVVLAATFRSWGVIVYSVYTRASSAVVLAATFRSWGVSVYSVYTRASSCVDRLNAESSRDSAS